MLGNIARLDTVTGTVKIVVSHSDRFQFNSEINFIVKTTITVKFTITTTTTDKDTFTGHDQLKLQSQ